MKTNILEMIEPQDIDVLEQEDALTQQYESSILLSKNGRIN